MRIRSGRVWGGVRGLLVAVVVGDPAQGGQNLASVSSGQSKSGSSEVETALRSAHRRTPTPSHSGPLSPERGEAAVGDIRTAVSPSPGTQNQRRPQLVIADVITALERSQPSLFVGLSPARLRGAGDDSEA